VNDAQRLFSAYQWAPEDRISLASRLAAQLYLAGDTLKARSEVDAALAIFASERHRMFDIDRADALIPVAEAYVAMGDKAAALTVYRQAVADGAENPNSRPRAEDLCATCCSMARHAVEPDAELWTKMREIREGLGDPW
jgi:tetratricopeptide (TPR) repeat protein